MKLTLVVLSVCFFSNGLSFDYCNKDICKVWNGISYEYKPHIACNNSEELGSNCPPETEVEDCRPYQSLILELHNEIRNKVALGKLKGFEPATRMPVLKWNDELAHLAQLNVKTCEYKHDKCDDTYDFKNVGQNLAKKMSTEKIDTKYAIKSIIDTWFDGHKDADMSIIKKFYSTSAGQAPVFTTMVVDRTSDIGCGVVKYCRDKKYFMLFACNYASTNIFDNPIYNCGPTASRCKTGTSLKYIGLCSELEKVDPNHI